MARANRKEDDGENSGDITGEYKKPDAAGAFKIYDGEIKSKLTHIATLRGDLSDPHKRIKDDCNFPRPVLNFIVGLENMEDAKRDHYLLALSEGLKVRKLYMPRDLVSMSQGVDGDNVVPLADRKRPGLATLGDDDSMDGEDFSEMAEEELAGQRDRPSSEQAQAEADAASEAAGAGEQA